ncbi:hypothetical protein LEP1GSC127_3497 [Leptospira kirschneri str. 200801925]|nr:hypothetical protein LEP1GSC127_3497 [Leptospira kirschneri str. 200801925]
MSLVRLCSGVINGTGVVDSGSANSLDSSTVTELSSSDQTSATETDDNFFALGVFVGVCLVVLFFLIFLAMLLLQADHFYF